ncbi:MAG: hypothetical protein ABIN69_18570 [Aestuariivirga sp.]
MPKLSFPSQRPAFQNLAVSLTFLSCANHLHQKIHLNSQLQMWLNFAIAAQSSGTVAVKRDSIAAIGQGSGAQQNHIEEPL